MTAAPDKAAARPGAVGVTVGEVLRAATAALADAGVEVAALEARLLVGRALALSREALFADPARPVSPGEARALGRLLARRRAQEPLAYILGEREFWSLPFVVSPAVLIPRPDSETLVETALRRLGEATGAPLRILDLGTGSGCLLLALLSELPAAFGVGADRSAAAADVARANAARLGLDRRSAFVCGDWGEALAGGCFDLIVANPPYIDAEGLAGLDATVRCFEPEAALSGGVDGLDAYRAVCLQLPRLLAPGGFAVVELAAGRLDAVARLCADAGLGVDGVGRDLAGHDRCVVLGRSPAPRAESGKNGLEDKWFPTTLGAKGKRAAPAGLSWLPPSEPLAP